ncbi:hypothetical protein DCAR_0312829 [Daucus carota subsp. sativus]|uniref:Zinc finger PMZ-type domain-containing protein n=1 Tax=Daucus carota subsp. sativus TaxID=79200 RepID=A0AAF0WS87_DAUCS|nr:hypothetical protein DCAR_0312829 [Daucus carota subsp. sativus]
MQLTDTYQIKVYDSNHTCTPTFHQKQINSRWIAEHYEDDIRMNPTWPLSSFLQKVVNDLHCHVSIFAIARAKRKALAKIKGQHVDQFGKVWEYGNELLKAMPDSTIQVMTEDQVLENDRKRFKRMKWEMSGIPCYHACACIAWSKKRYQDFIHPCYTKDVYLECYKHIVEPICGEEEWQTTNYPKPLPPEVKPQTGRPKKKRNKANDVVEKDPTRLRRQNTKVKCSNWVFNKQPPRDKVLNTPLGIQPQKFSSKNQGTTTSRQNIEERRRAMQAKLRENPVWKI